MKPYLNCSLWRGCAILLLLGLLWHSPARAAPPNCTATMTPLAFGSISPQSSQTDTTATINWSCPSTDNSLRVIDLCIGIDTPTNPRAMTSGGNSLNYQIYQDAARTIWWGNTFDNSPNQAGKAYGLTVQTLGSGGTATGTIPVYGRVLGGQTTAVPGTYVAAPSLNAIMINNSTLDCSGTNYSSSMSSISVSANVQNACTVTAGANLNLGTVSAGTVNTSGSNSISVTCPPGTAYYVGLLPSNGNTSGAGVMSGTGGSTDKVPYQLYSNAGLTAAWGNTATSNSQGNGVAGSGTGTAQTITVYASAPGADFQPGSYTDTVTVNVNY